MAANCMMIKPQAMPGKPEAKPTWVDPKTLPASRINPHYIAVVRKDRGPFVVEESKLFPGHAGRGLAIRWIHAEPNARPMGVWVDYGLGRVRIR